LIQKRGGGEKGAKKQGPEKKKSAGYRAPRKEPCHGIISLKNRKFQPQIYPLQQELKGAS